MMLFLAKIVHYITLSFKIRKESAFNNTDWSKSASAAHKKQLLKLRTHLSVTVSFCQFSDSQFLISCIFGSNWTLYFRWKFLLLLLLLPISLMKIHKIRNFQSLNWQKLAVTVQCVRGFMRGKFLDPKVVLICEEHCTWYRKVSEVYINKLMKI